MRHSIHRPPALADPSPLRAVFALALLAAPLGACNDRSATPVERAAVVHTELVQPQMAMLP